MTKEKDWKKQAEKDAEKTFMEFILQYNNNVPSLENNACKKAVGVALGVAQKEIDRLEKSERMIKDDDDLWIGKGKKDFALIRKLDNGDGEIIFTGIDCSILTKEVSRLKKENDDLRSCIKQYSKILLNKCEGCKTLKQFQILMSKVSKYSKELKLIPFEKVNYSILKEQNNKLLAEKKEMMRIINDLIDNTSRIHHKGEWYVHNNTLKQAIEKEFRARQQK